MSSHQPHADTNGLPAMRIPPLLLFLVASPLLYATVLNGFFVSDDFVLLRAVRNGGPLGIWSGDGPCLRPLVSLSLYLDVVLWGLRPLGYHLTNVVLHGFNAFLVHGIARRLGRSRSESVLAGVLFLLLPCHGEAVAWISGRTDILATLFVLVATERYLAGRGGGQRLALGISVAAFGAALLSKESAVILPLILLAHELAQGGRTAWRRISTYAPAAGHWAALAGYLLLRVQVLHLQTAEALRFDALSGSANFLVNLYKTVATYWPAALLGWKPFLKAHMGPLLVGLTVVGLLGGVACWRLVRRRPPGDVGGADWRLVAFLLSAWCLGLLPVISRSTNLFSSESDRFLYLPSVFAVLLISLLLHRFRRRVFVVATGALVVLYGLFLLRTLDNWRTAATMSQSILSALEARTPRDDIEVLVLPDNIAGAYVFRNGLPEAEELFTNRKRTAVLVTYELYDKASVPTWERTERGVRLELTMAGSRFYVRSAGSPACAQVHTTDPGNMRLEVDLRACRQKTPILAFDGRALIGIP